MLCFGNGTVLRLLLELLEDKVLLTLAHIRLEVESVELVIVMQGV